MIIINVPPGSPSWHRARLGVVTASAVDQILTGSGEPRMPTYYGRSPMPAFVAEIVRPAAMEVAA